MNPARVLTALVGVLLVAAIFWDAVETILVPRRIDRRVRLTRWFYVLGWSAWRAAGLRELRPARRESVLGFFGPLSQVLLLACWAGGLIVAFALLQLAAESHGAGGAGELLRNVYMSGETFFTLGFGDVTPATITGRWLSVIEAGMGFGFLGTVVGYLPTMYGAFSQREVGISLLDARAGSPPTAVEFLGRLGSQPAARADELLHEWERWSATLLETHISYPQLSYYRSQHSNQSWLGALVCILDSSALVVAGVDAIPPGQARLTFAMARHALVDVAQVFVSRPLAAPRDRLPAAALAELRTRLAGTSAPLDDAPDFAERLDALRAQYEPYALALAEYLLIELPPWLHAEPRRDNWQGGPWDRELDVRAGFEPDEDHF